MAREFRSFRPDVFAGRCEHVVAAQRFTSSASAGVRLQLTSGTVRNRRGRAAEQIGHHGIATLGNHDGGCCHDLQTRQLSAQPTWEVP
jgi:hypothetical protein